MPLRNFGMENKPKRTNSALVFFCKANGIIPAITLSQRHLIKHSFGVNDNFIDRTQVINFNYKKNAGNI